MLDRVAESLGASTRRSINEVGALGIFLWEVVRALPAALARFHLVVEQMLHLGVYSIPVVSLSSAFVGAVSAWQAKYLFSDVIPPIYLGTAVGKAVFTELGPVLTALVFTGRVGAKLAAELGTMRVTEQLDAMTTLSLDPYKYLLAPRLFAGAIMAPVLTIFSAFIAILCAQFLAWTIMGLFPTEFYHGLRLFFRTTDVVICLVKAFVFGVLTSLCGCYFGFMASGGAIGVGEATKKAVVASMVLILVANLIIVKIVL